MRYEIDATNQSLGRLATKIAVLLRGKNLPTFDPSKMPDSQVVLKNINKIKFTGNKMQGTSYYRYSGFPGGLKETTLEKYWEKNPKEVVRQCVLKMLPENRQRSRIIKNLLFE